MTHATVAGTVFACLVIAVIIVAATVTTVLVTRRAVAAMRRRGWSEPAIAWSALAVIQVTAFLGGWLVLDLWWLLRALRKAPATAGGGPAMRGGASA